MRTIHTLMSIAHKLGRITDRELEEGRLETIAFWRGGERPPPAFRWLSDLCSKATRTTCPRFLQMMGRPQIPGPSRRALTRPGPRAQLPKKAPKLFGARLRANALGHLERVIETPIATDAEHRCNRARLRIGTPVDHASNSGENERTRTHRTRLERHVRRRPAESPVAPMRGRRSNAPRSLRAQSDPSDSRARFGLARARYRPNRRSRTPLEPLRLRPRSELHRGPRSSRSSPRPSQSSSRTSCPRDWRQLAAQARPGRFELPTPGSVDQCSIQLSYGRSCPLRGRHHTHVQRGVNGRARCVVARPPCDSVTVARKISDPETRPRLRRHDTPLAQATRPWENARSAHVLVDRPLAARLWHARC